TSLSSACAIPPRFPSSPSCVPPTRNDQGGPRSRGNRCARVHYRAGIPGTLVEWGLLFSFALFLWLTGCGFFRLCLGFRFFRSRRFLFRRLFIGVAAVIGVIEPRTFKDNSGARARQPFHLAVDQFFQLANMLGTFPLGIYLHGFDGYELFI